MEEPRPQIDTEWKPNSSGTFERDYIGNRGQYIAEEYVPSHEYSTFSEHYRDAYRRISLGKSYSIDQGQRVDKNNVGIFLANPDGENTTHIQVDTFADSFLIGFSNVKRDENGYLVPDADVLCAKYSADGTLLSAYMRDTQTHSLRPDIKEMRDYTPEKLLQDLWPLIDAADCIVIEDENEAVIDILDSFIVDKYTLESPIVDITGKYAEQTIYECLSNAFSDPSQLEKMKEFLGKLKLKQQFQQAILERTDKNDYDGKKFIYNLQNSDTTRSELLEDLKLLLIFEIQHLIPLLTNTQVFSVNEFSTQGFNWLDTTQQFSSGFGIDEYEEKENAHGTASYYEMIEAGGRIYRVRRNYQYQDLVVIESMDKNKNPLSLVELPFVLSVNKERLNQTLDPNVATTTDYIKKVGFDKDFDIRQLTGLFLATGYLTER